MKQLALISLVLVSVACSKDKKQSAKPAAPVAPKAADVVVQPPVVKPDDNANQEPVDETAGNDIPKLPIDSEDKGESDTSNAALIGTWGECFDYGQASFLFSYKFEANGGLVVSSASYKDGECKTALTEEEIAELVKDYDEEEKEGAKESFRPQSYPGTYVIGKALVEGSEIDLKIGESTEFAAFKIEAGVLVIAGGECQEEDFCEIEEDSGSSAGKRNVNFKNAYYYAKR